MWNVIVCDHNKAEQEKLTAYVQNCCKDAGVSVQIQGCADWTELAQKIKKAEPDMVIVAQNGVEGLDIITSARLLSGKIVWFSDLDFGVQAYRLCVAYFSKKPITRPKVERALARCMEVRLEVENSRFGAYREEEVHGRDF
ncbi:hypothetical protein HGO97_003685 [Faecalicatena sp. AGMB00832]|uniref:Response regulator receiver domain-containing protein n=1 Tax=Faecalicatena faecalis TaxID=2726362 RepID=A0ABS6D007_9FIRM|nr:hypothetical protein [Faecalicatena faecalis]MBU3874914.1 hypothetical protein [Faecalicatena faecalis]